jgi:anti-anti-sigma factor
MPLTIESHFCENVFILECTGQIVIGHETKALESTLELAKREFRHIVIGLRHVTRLDSVGLGLLVRTVATLRRNGGDLRIANPPEFVTDLLKLTRLTSFLQTCASEEEAIASFLTEVPDERLPDDGGYRVLLIDRSPDIGAFVRAVLSQHGYQVRSASLISDARTLLRFQSADYILFGPGTPETAVEAGAATLRSLAPRAVPLALAAEFPTYDAQQATDVLLGKFRSSAGQA